MFGVSQIIGALLMYGVGRIDTSFHTWRLMFLICGALTIITGVVFLWLMPRDTSTAWFLTERERTLAAARLALDRATRDRTNFNWPQAKEAFTDPRTYMYALMGITITLPTAIVKFSSIVIQGFGFSDFQTLLVGLPGGALAFCLVWIGALVPTHYPNARCYTGLFVVAMPLLGSLLLLLLPASKNWGIVVSTWFAGSTAPPLNIVLGLLASNVRGNTKKSVVGAIFFIIFCVGSIASPQFWQAADAPRYRKGCIVSVCSWAVLLTMLMTFLFTAKRSNAKRDLKAQEDSDYSEQGVPVSVDSDHTERQDCRFRYTH
ncbi:uncharacterized protein A1O9_08930 [Exophiala aquamarina CBS 119918]|uniref:Major facilitator superfamily (MFS) profile domain-containing protein n=1 Tax=Exophiala aquamarina CBS 119918 TaxID=1182545 RepID=A0A072P635_9EURO|nr:uncharacterized protein A1O9_08930 [Exophiala aquamarina CBS 119918]KEF55276.1 hypothetical protein A1O9_08930 [Exophiala aquamarina CBS 119918]